MQDQGLLLGMKPGSLNAGSFLGAGEEQSSLWLLFARWKLGEKKFLLSSEKTQQESFNFGFWHLNFGFWHLVLLVEDGAWSSPEVTTLRICLSPKSLEKWIYPPARFSEAGKSREKRECSCSQPGNDLGGTAWALSYLMLTLLVTGSTTWVYFEVWVWTHLLLSHPVCWISQIYWF